MSNLEFIIAMATVVLALVAVIVGVIFLAVRAKKKSTSQPAEKMVYISTGNGRKYHSDPFCFTHEDGNCEKIELSKAVKRGYTPCAKCIKTGGQNV